MTKKISNIIVNDKLVHVNRELRNLLDKELLHELNRIKKTESDNYISGILYDIEKLSKLYDVLYDYADKLLKIQDLCSIKKCNGKTLCNYNRFGNGSRVHLCCQGCDYISDKGCTVKALGCKIRFCWSNEYIYNTLANSLDNTKLDNKLVGKWLRLQKIADKYLLNFIPHRGCRLSKQEVLRANIYRILYQYERKQVWIKV